MLSVVELSRVPFRTISVIPTVQEMNTALEGVGSHGHARVPNDVPRPPFDQSANELLDGHFRLLRHDMLGSAFEQLHERNVSRRRRNKVHDTLYKVQALQPNPKYGAEISFSFQLHNEHPVFHLSQRQAKEDALDRSAIFKRDALLMLMRDKKAVHIARVAKTDKANLAKGEINLTFPDQSSLVTILGELTDVKAHAKKGGRLNAVNGKDAESGAGSGFTAIAIAASFFSYEPVLRRLQTMHTLQFDTEFVQSKVLERTMPDTTYWPSGGEYRDRYIQEYARNKGLNESQANALSRGARKRVALIQGPPGTGKTYVGAALAEMILLRGKQKILVCLCKMGSILGKTHLERRQEKSTSRERKRERGRDSQDRLREITRIKRPRSGAGKDGQE